MTARSTLRFVPLAALVASACIIPDRDIGFESDQANPGAVRIVQPTLLAPEMNAACTETDEALRDLDQCPQVPIFGTRHSGLIARAPDEPFCVCPGGHDLRTLDEFYVYAEDPDRAQEEPVDDLVAVALLDFDPFVEPAETAVAYDQHMGPAEIVLDRNVPRSWLSIVASTGRENNDLWRFRFGKSGGRGTDLCNDNVGNPVSVGLHTLSIMVTDRPFFQPPRLDADGEPVLDQHGNVIYDPVQVAMPDLAVGATYSIASWVFECHSPEVNTKCACAEGAPP